MTSARLNAIRVSLHVYNDSGDIQSLVGALATIDKAQERTSVDSSTVPAKAVSDTSPQTPIGLFSSGERQSIGRNSWGRWQIPLVDAG